MRQLLKLSNRTRFGSFELENQECAILGVVTRNLNGKSWWWKNRLTGKYGESPTKTEARRALIESLDGFVIEVKE